MALDLLWCCQAKKPPVPSPTTRTKARALTRMFLLLLVLEPPVEAWLALGWVSGVVSGSVGAGGVDIGRSGVGLFVGSVVLSVWFVSGCMAVSPLWLYMLQAYVLCINLIYSMWGGCGQVYKKVCGIFKLLCLKTKGLVLY